MFKLISYLCLALVACHPTDAGVWPFNGNGERSSNSNPVYSDADTLNLVNVPGYTGLQYFENADPQVVAQQQQQQITLPELVEAQPDSTAEHKTNYGTKGISRFLTRNKSKQSNILQPVSLLPATYATSPDLFVNSGYIETAFPVTANLTTEVSKGNKIRSYLPWNWVFVRSQKDETGQQPTQDTKPVAPKRSWSILPPYRPVVTVPSRPSQFCQCYPSVPSYPVYPYPLPAEDQPQANPMSNVRQVVPSDDHHGLDSNPVASVVPAPQTISNAQSHLNLPAAPQSTQQNQPQQHSTNEQVAPLTSASVNEPSSVQQVAPSQVQYVPYHGSGSTYSNIPVTNNFHSSSTGESTQNVPASNAK